MRHPEYFEWQKLLEDKLIGHNQRTIMFFVDEDELARLKPSSPNAANDLSSAVMQRLYVHRGKDMFRSITADLALWTRAEQMHCPPVLPVIALSVLAATRMRTESDVRATNYYHRLAELLATGNSEAEVRFLRSQLREGGAFVDVVQMWESLHKWLIQIYGESAASTIKTDRRLQRIGYPLSQAIIRDSDKGTLTRLFKAMDILSASFPGEDEILNALDLWTMSTRNRLSRAGMRALKNEDTRSLLGKLVSALGRNWDGKVLVPDGNIRIELKLSLDIEEWSSEWVFGKSADVPHQNINLNASDGRAIVLEPDPGSDLFLTNKRIAVHSTDIERGLAFSGEGHSASFLASEIVFLIPDMNTGGWTSVLDIAPYTDYLVAVHARRVDSFKQFLDRVAIDGWRLMPQPGRQLLPDFALFESVEFDGKVNIDEVAKLVPGTKLIGVSTNVSQRAKLVEGLPIATDLNRSSYLVGGEPDLQIPASTENGTTTVILDGRKAEFANSGVAVSLRHFVDGPGEHTISVCGQELKFQSLNADPRRANFSSPGTKRDVPGRGSLKVKTHIPSPLPHEATRAHQERILARRGRDETWVLQSDGRALQVFESAPPGFLDSLAVDFYLPNFDVELPNDAEWLAQRRGNTWLLNPVAAKGEEYELRSVDILRAWRLACKSENAMRLWKFQLEIAR